jgi:hypothetical protein
MRASTDIGLAVFVDCKPRDSQHAGHTHRCRKVDGWKEERRGKERGSGSWLNTTLRRWPASLQSGGKPCVILMIR